MALLSSSWHGGRVELHGWSSRGRRGVLPERLTILGIVAERDQDHRDRAFMQSGLTRTLEGIAVGRWLIRFVFILMILADVHLLVWLHWPKKQ